MVRFEIVWISDVRLIDWTKTERQFSDVSTRLDRFIDKIYFYDPKKPTQSSLVKTYEN